MARQGAFPAAQKKMREFAKTRIMPDDSQGFHPARCLRKQFLQGVNAGVVERSFEFACWFLRQFTQNHVECIARAQRRRNEAEIENETGCAKISAHSRRVGVALRRQPPFMVAVRCGSTGFGVANEEEPWHRAR